MLNKKTSEATVQSLVLVKPKKNGNEVLQSVFGP